MTAATLTLVIQRSIKHYGAIYKLCHRPKDSNPSPLLFIVDLKQLSLCFCAETREKLDEFVHVKAQTHPLPLPEDVIDARMVTSHDVPEQGEGGHFSA